MGNNSTFASIANALLAKIFKPYTCVTKNHYICKWKSTDTVTFRAQGQSTVNLVSTVTGTGLLRISYG
jgi:hypothetical protein